MNSILQPADNLELFVSYLNLVTIVLGSLAFFDFLIKFRRPLTFKICYIILISSLLYLDILFWLDFTFADILQYSPFINFGIWGAGLYALSILNSGKIEKWVWWSSGFIFILNLNNYFTLTSLNTSSHNGYAVFSLRLKDHLDLINITRYLQRFILIFSLFKLIKTIRINKAFNNLYQSKLVNWVTLFVVFTCCSIILNAVITNLFFANSHYLSFLFVLYNLFCISVFLLTIYRPAFLNNHDIAKFDWKKFSQQDALKLDDHNFYAPFFSNFYYLNKEATIEHFCKENNIEEKDMFNEQIFKLYQMNFSNLINKKRVEYFVEIAKNPKYAQYSIEGLALEAGFNSRTALYKPFKKFHGGTPIDLIESIKR
jgi:AraC-like DNA-binding protein